MPYKSGKLKGELTGAELRKLIRAHNILSKITIPKGTDRDGLIKLIEKHDYKVDHTKQGIYPKVKRGKKISLKEAEELTKTKPPTEAEKKKRDQAKRKKKGKEAFLKHTIPKPPPKGYKPKRKSPKVIKKVKKIYINKGDGGKVPKQVLSQAEVQSKWADIQANYNIDAGDKNRVDNIVANNDRIKKFRVANQKYLKIKYGDKVQVQIEVEKK